MVLLVHMVEHMVEHMVVENILVECKMAAIADMTIMDTVVIGIVVIGVVVIGVVAIGVVVIDIAVIDIAVPVHMVVCMVSLGESGIEFGEAIPTIGSMEPMVVDNLSVQTFVMV